MIQIIKRLENKLFIKLKNIWKMNSVLINLKNKVSSKEILEAVIHRFLRLKKKKNIFNKIPWPKIKIESL